eukprot:GHVR01082603.1.p1 GENE.GHVR01082603.1~~GHVR01082603.1.p1  ORF type:complete len:168 (+),score=24.40 GHVR01082603.1:9-512(+)
MNSMNKLLLLVLLLPSTAYAQTSSPEVDDIDRGSVQVVLKVLHDVHKDNTIKPYTNHDNFNEVFKERFAIAAKVHEEHVIVTTSFDGPLMFGVRVHPRPGQSVESLLRHLIRRKSEIEGLYLHIKTKSSDKYVVADMLVTKVLIVGPAEYDRVHQSPFLEELIHKIK